MGPWPTRLLSLPQGSPHHPAAAPLCAAARAAPAAAAASFQAQRRLLSRRRGSLRQGARAQASGSAGDSGSDGRRDCLLQGDRGTRGRAAWLVFKADCHLQLDHWPIGNLNPRALRSFPAAADCRSSQVPRQTVEQDQLSRTRSDFLLPIHRPVYRL